MARTDTIIPARVASEVEATSGMMPLRSPAWLSRPLPGCTLGAFATGGSAECRQGTRPPRVCHWKAPPVPAATTLVAWSACRARGLCMAAILAHADGLVTVSEVDHGARRIEVRMNDRAAFSPRTEWLTRYPLGLIRAVLDVKGPAYLCDEIARDEDPAYLESDLRAAVFGYVPAPELDGQRILDFGCGSGASTVVLARLLPRCRLYGVDLQEDLLALARLRAEHYGLDNVVFLSSPSPDRLPAGIAGYETVLLSAVYEHLLPAERTRLLLQMWDGLEPGGVLFINQTPDRRFPLEMHTTGLPLINQLPDRAVLAIARRCSARGLRGSTWEQLLRKGIRGATPDEIFGILRGAAAPPARLAPVAAGARQQSDIWYLAARRRLQDRYRGWRRLAVLAVMDSVVKLRIPVAPYLSLAIRKPDARRAVSARRTP